MSPQLQPSDFPALCRAASQAAVRSQRLYLWLVRLNLGLLIVGAALDFLADSFPAHRHGLSVSSAVVFGASIIASLFLQSLAPESAWFAGRSIAESVKTLAWRFMTCAEPYQAALGSRDAEGRFLSDLHLIMAEKKSLAWTLSTMDLAEPQITETMRRLRSADIPTRLEMYLSGRIRDQRTWYSSKASSCRKAQVGWFFCVIIAQAAALATAILRVSYAESLPNLTGVFAGTAAACMAWMQIKRQRELAQAYALAAHELGLIQEKARNVTTEAELAAFVADSENAISREHTMWVARRDV